MWRLGVQRSNAGGVAPVGSAAHAKLDCAFGLHAGSLSVLDALLCGLFALLPRLGSLCFCQVRE